MTLVSVVVPVHNVEPYLAECLDSVLNQTLRDLEIVCVNDGSTDGSSVVLKEYETLDSRITVINQENLGLGAARNRGVRHATGDYLYFLDSDDYLKQDALAKLYECAQATNSEIVYFNTTPVFETSQLKTEFSHYVEYCKRRRGFDGVKSGIEMLSEMAASWDWKPMVWLQFIKSDFYRRTALCFVEDARYEDEVFALWGAFRASRTSYLEESLHYYRIRNASIMTKPPDPAAVLEMLKNVLAVEEDFMNMKPISIEHVPMVAQVMDGLARGAYRNYLELSNTDRDSVASEITDPRAFARLLMIKREVWETEKAIRSEKERKELEVKVDRLNRRLRELERSRSFRLGRSLTFPARKTKALARRVLQMRQQNVNGI